MDKLIEEVGNLINLPVGQNFYKYRDIYKRVFNREAPTCKCQGLSIQNELKIWYISKKDTNGL